MSASKPTESNTPPETLSGADIVVRLLERQGITTIAGIPGGAILPIYDALSKSAIHHVLARHEQGGGFMAQGMARDFGLSQSSKIPRAAGSSNAAGKASRIPSLNILVSA